MPIAEDTGSMAEGFPMSDEIIPDADPVDPVNPDETPAEEPQTTRVPQTAPEPQKSTYSH